MASPLNQYAIYDCNILRINLNEMVQRRASSQGKELSNEQIDDIAVVLTGLPPDRILHDLNQLALNDLDQSHRFVTLFYSDYDPRTRKLRFANAAHNPPLLWKSSDQKIIKLDAKGFVLGLQKDAEYHCGEIKLNQNDLVLYYTDGVIDTSNSLGQRFDEERLIKTLTKLCKQSYTSQEILNKIFKKLDDFTGQNRHLEDDASMVIFQLK